MTVPAADITLFAHVADRPDEELDLARAALLVAEPHYPGLDIPRYVDALEQLGRRASERVATTDGSHEQRAKALLKLLYADEGFAGNQDDYYDPRNSFLNEVLDRRTGIPLSLALVLLEVAWRAGIEARGVNFPGHFLARLPGSKGPIVVDPFAGKILSPEELRRLQERATGGGGDGTLVPQLLAPTTRRQILVRMLNNLRAIYRARGRSEPLRGVLLKLRVLLPTDEEIAAELASLAPPPTPRRLVN